MNVPYLQPGNSAAEPFENELVPDAFGVQVLSGGHRLDLSERDEWQVEPLASGRVLVKHVDPALWFDGSLVPFGTHRPEPPSFVVRAPEHFASVLLNEEIARRWKDELDAEIARRWKDEDRAE